MGGKREKKKMMNKKARKRRMEEEREIEAKTEREWKETTQDRG